MGGGSSTPTPKPAEIYASPTVSIKHEAVRRVPIFEKAQQELKRADMVNLLQSEVDSSMDMTIKDLLIDALGGFFFLEGEEEDSLRMDLLLRAMRKESEDAGTFIMREGEAGSKLYVVESGDLEVTIEGALIRHMHRGALIGELALLYNAPRSATVKCLSNCVFWVLSRDMFKSIQAMAASASMMQRSTWLINCPEFQALGSVEMSRLMGSLQTATYKAGEKLYEMDAVSSRIILVEKGSAVIELPACMDGLTAQEIDSHLGIIRPVGYRRKSVSAMSIAELYEYMNGGEGSEGQNEDGPTPNNDGTCIVHEGCLLGVAALRAKATTSDFGLWKWVQPGGAQSPVTVRALDIMQCSVFTVELFERLYGPACEVLPSLMSNERVLLTGDTNSFAMEQSNDDTKMDFEESNFEFVRVLGKGSYGIVMLAKHEKTSTHYALKRLSKTGVIETGQLRHVLDERKLIATINSPFVVKVFGSYQTIKELVLVTESVNRGDLWSVIYETAAFSKGVPSELVHFYTASIVMALSHIHKKNIAYRDLKPENIMIDEAGYIRVIDFGFAKKIPYTVTDPATGDVKVHVKSYTLCGTPGTIDFQPFETTVTNFLTEYLAPEFIFNSGNDHSVDLWALGVMMHEMYLLKTPFNPKRKNDMTELFTNIASVKVVTISCIIVGLKMTILFREAECRWQPLLTAGMDLLMLAR
jgi:tRNA A-37 threonylcarbamoyl transferase component Bud32